MSVVLKGRAVEVVVDTGSWLSLITEAAASAVGLRDQETGESVRLSGLGKGCARMLAPVSVQFGDHTDEVAFGMVDSFPFPICIGLQDFLRLIQSEGGLLPSLTVGRCPGAAAQGATTTADHTSGVVESATDEQLLEEGRQTLLKTGGARLEPEVFNRIWDVFRRHSACWLRPRSGKFTGPPAVIRPTKAPVRGKRRPMSPVMKDAVAEMLESQLKAGVIEPAKSEWASPIHIVTKKDGSYRIVIDYREVNKRIKTDTYPLPLISEIVRESSGHQFYIKLDMNWGFWNLGLEEESREVAAFITHMGLFQPRVLPFGMKNSPGEFQRAVDFAFSSMTGRKCKIYIDDIVIFANSLDELLELLDSVLTCAVKHGLYLKLAKSEILPEEVTLLGYKVGPNGFRADPARIEALRKVAYPKDKKQLRSFVAACSYLREFIPGFADLTAPFRPLLKEKSPWHWDDALSEAHDELLTNLSDAVVLQGPHGNGPFLLVCDASGYAVGGCLLQLQGERFVPLGFFSKSLSETEQRWDTRERELYAIKWGLERNRDLVRGHQVLVLTDHSSLQWTADAPSAKILRWRWFISQFDVKIMHIAGKLNVIADWLSRNTTFAPDHDEDIETVAMPCCATQPVNRVSLPTVKELTEELDAAPQADVRLCYRGTDGLLYGARTTRLYIPPKFRSSLIYWFHAGPYGCHRGVNSSTRQLKKYVWWPRMQESVSTFIKRCLPCQRNRAPKRSTATMVLRRPSPFELVSIDFVGPRQFGTTEWYYAVLIDHSSRFILTFPCNHATTGSAITALRDRWVATFGAPSVLLSDNGSQFTSREFRQYVTKDLKSHLVYSSPYYPAGNAINESSHQVLEHGIKCRIQGGTAETFPQLLQCITLAYNASYQGAIADSPFGRLFGKPLILPGFQGLSTTAPEEQRVAHLHYHQARELLAPFQPKVDTSSPPSDGTRLRPGDFVLYPLGEHEKARHTPADSCASYSPTWSLPCKVEEVKSQQVVVTEYGTNRQRRVAVSQVRLVPRDLPPVLADINWTHLSHTLPARWSRPLSEHIPYYAHTTDSPPKMEVVVEEGAPAPTPGSSATTTTTQLKRRRTP